MQGKNSSKNMVDTGIDDSLQRLILNHFKIRLGCVGDMLVSSCTFALPGSLFVASCSSLYDALRDFHGESPENRHDV